MTKKNVLPELEAEALDALDAQAEGADEEGNIQITNENALIIMAQAMIGIEKHLMAIVYLQNTREPEKSGVGYLPDVFQSIYDGSDPFKEVDEQVKAAAAKAAETAAGRETAALEKSENDSHGP